MDKISGSNKEKKTIEIIPANNIVKDENDFPLFHRIAAIVIIGAVFFGLWVFFFMKK